MRITTVPVHPVVQPDQEPHIVRFTPLLIASHGEGRVHLKDSRKSERARLGEDVEKWFPDTSIVEQLLQGRRKVGRKDFRNLPESYPSAG
jgi:hypothetical protein